MSNSLWSHGLYSPWNSPGQNTVVGSCSLLQGMFPAQGSNPGLLHCGQIIYQLRHQGNPRILEWVAYPFSSKSSQPRNRTQISCIAGGFFTSWTTREAHELINQTTIFYQDFSGKDNNKLIKQGKKKNGTMMPSATTWMDLEIIILSKSDKDKYHMVSLICGI